VSNPKAPGQAAFEAFASVMSPEATWETRSMKERGAWARAEVAAQGAPTIDTSRMTEEGRRVWESAPPAVPQGAPCGYCGGSGRCGLGVCAGCDGSGKNP
jgi:hypothetical protein